MDKINVHQAKTHLSKYLRRLKKGQILTICNRNRPVAELKKVGDLELKSRKIGWAKGQFELKKSFFDPLPKEIEDAFSGAGE